MSHGGMSARDRVVMVSAEDRLSMCRSFLFFKVFWWRLNDDHNFLQLRGVCWGSPEVFVVFVEYCLYVTSVCESVVHDQIEDRLESVISSVLGKLRCNRLSDFPVFWHQMTLVSLLRGRTFWAREIILTSSSYILRIILRNFGESVVQLQCCTAGWCSRNLIASSTIFCLRGW